MQVTPHLVHEGAASSITEPGRAWPWPLASLPSESLQAAAPPTGGDPAPSSLTVQALAGEAKATFGISSPAMVRPLGLDVISGAFRGRTPSPASAPVARPPCAGPSALALAVC